LLCGCKHLGTTSNVLFQNYQILRVKRGLHPNFPSDPAFVASIERDLEKRSKASGRASTWQFNFFVLGAIFFIAWHVLKMYERTISPAVPAQMFASPANH
jgi:hypothetical protein